MHRLTHRDLSRALRFLSACNAGGGLHTFAVSVTAALPALIPADVAVFGMINPSARILQAVENPRMTSAADLDTFVRVTQDTPSPPLDHFARTSDPEARRISDFVTRRQFHALPVYTDFYRPLRLEFMLGVFINNSSTAFDGVTLNRARRDFTERDRSILTLLRPHIVHAYHTALAVDRLRTDLILALRAFETPGFGMIVTSEDRRMRLLSPSAAALLARYFGRRRNADELPDSLDRWVRQCTETARDSSRLPPLQAPFAVERNGACLVVRLVNIARDTLLLLEEPATRGDWLRLEPLGLTAGDARMVLECLREDVLAGGAPISPDIVRRVISRLRNIHSLAPAAHRLTPHEVRLLGLLVEGHRYKTAAAVLGSSVHTVAFHLKHIYDKLQVHSKSEAVAKALRDRIVR
jgi:DNA-binding CsgD family transcriptional regulator